MQLQTGFGAILWHGAVVAALLAVESVAADRPNILIIVTDDMGYSDPGCYGGEIHTPNIDRLASGGLRFSQFYNCARCCPTRASLLTGGYPQRVGMGQFGRTMDKEVPTLAENLRAAGYVTAMMGKWHLTQLPETKSREERIRWMNHQVNLGIPFGELASYPTRRGFDQFYGIIWGVVSHFDPFSLTDGEAAVPSVPADYYLTDAISDRSVACIRDFADSDQPFFLYIAYTAPHWPIQAPEEDIARYRGRYANGWSALRKDRFKRQQELGMFNAATPLGPVSGEEQDWDQLPSEERDYLARKMEVHAAMVDRVDQGIGRIVSGLKETDQLANTVIFFLSDNGASPEIPGPPGYDRHSETRDGRRVLRDAELQHPAHRAKLGSDESYTGIGPQWASAVNTPLRYWKAQSYEGGCRTPLVVHWPEGIEGQVGQMISSVGHVIDLSPTCLELARAQPLQGTLQDGVSLLPVLTGNQTTPERTLYFEHEEGRGIRHHQWKAAKRGGRGWELFDLSTDPGETHNLADANPQLLKSLNEDWSTWYRNVSQDGDEPPKF